MVEGFIPSPVAGAATQLRLTASETEFDAHQDLPRGFFLNYDTRTMFAAKTANVLAFLFRQ
jgi:hypothetical protein